MCFAKTTSSGVSDTYQTVFRTPLLKSILDVLLLKNPTKRPLVVCHHLFDPLVIHLLAIEFCAQKLVLFPYFVFITHIHYLEPTPLVISGRIG